MDLINVRGLGRSIGPKFSVNSPEEYTLKYKSYQGCNFVILYE